MSGHPLWTVMPFAGRSQDAPSLQLLPYFTLRCANVTVKLPPLAQRLVTYVALQNRPVRRSQAAATLWSDASAVHAAAALRTTLWRVNHACEDLLNATATHILLAQSVSVDVRDAMRLTRAITNDPSVPSEVVESALSSLSADLLPDLDDEWLGPAQENWRQLRLHALENLANHLADTGRHVLAVEAALAAVTTDPLRETAHQCLIHIHLAEGNRAEAMRAYLRLVHLLNHELGVPPGPEVQAMIANLPLDRLHN